MYTFLTLTRSVRMLLLAVSVGVCLNTLQAQTQQDQVATAIVIDGWVSVVRGSSQVALFTTLKKNEVRAKEDIVTGPDGHAVFQLRDGSTFEVFPNSRVTFQPNYNLQDLLEMILGKIRVTIEHKNGPNHKKVSTPTALISVRGTVFDVDVEDDIGTTLVSVEQGQVWVDHRLQPSVTKVLNENQWLRVYANVPFAKNMGPSPGAVRFVFDRIKGVFADLVFHNPAGIPGGGGGVPGTSGGQADGGKNKKPAPAPPAAPPPPPGGGN